MGVPAFFRWLSKKYACVIVDCVENKNLDPNTGETIYEDATLPNPNGVEFDNLYLDMNGIIHPCTHPEDKPAPKNEDEMMVAIFECIDRLFGIVRPRKLLYMAIDGVAPRAKMNQQRSRRFRAAKETNEKRMEIQKIRDELLVKGYILPPEKTDEEHFDSNCITPGTPFMDRLSKCLHYYIHDRMNTNPAWKGIKVVLSDANVPGEGEHKIMDYIRKQRAQPDHDANTQHVLCGADADLIMLGLATHEPNFTIIREEFLPNKPRPCEICKQYGHEMQKCVGLGNASGSKNESFKPDAPINAEVRFIFVRLSVLREYLKKTLEMPNLPFKYDFERALDDWVFMCFFVGNDFLPHLPSLEIREGAVDRLVELYKKCVYKTGGYLTNSGEVNLQRVQMILMDLGNVEDNIFKERQRREMVYKARQKRSRENEYKAESLGVSSFFQPTAVNRGPSNSQQPFNYKEEAAKLRTQNNKGVKRTAAEVGLDNDSDENDNDEVRLHEAGFKNRYYESKFDVGTNNQGFRYSVALQYVRGLCWVLKYYYQGCASWDWYFPYHYAPFASDFVNITGLSTNFDKGTKPFNPLEQLMGVFPAASSSHVPKPWATLMSDPDSPIIDFYPEDFKIDLNGKKFAWQGVALLPFVDERRLFKALKPYYKKLTEEEIRRNKRGDNRLYIGQLHNKFEWLKHQLTSLNSMEQEFNMVLDGMAGSILKAEDNIKISGTLKSPIFGLPNIILNEVISFRFRDPEYDSDFIFPAKRLTNAIDPPNVLNSRPEGQSGHNRPVIGFNRNQPTGHLSAGGHRMVQASLGRNSYNMGGNNRGHYPRGPNPQQNFQSRSDYNNFQNNYGNNFPGGNNNRTNQQNQHRGGHQNNRFQRYNPYGQTNNRF